MAKRMYRRDGLVRWIDDEGYAHREDGPASVWPEDTQWRFHHGWFHFAHGPAAVWPDGLMGWYEDNKLLRWREPYG